MDTHNAEAPLPSVPDSFTPFFNSWWAMQQLQWQLLAGWQAANVAWQRELWDEWTVHWAGGAPID